MYVLSRALAVSASAAAAIEAEVLALAAGLAEPGFNGRGGGARSGSELSHLRFPRNLMLASSNRRKTLESYEERNRVANAQKGVHWDRRAARVRERGLMLEHKLPVTGPFSIYRRHFRFFFLVYVAQ